MVGPRREPLRGDAQAYFIWDVPVTVGQVRELLRHPDLGTRALWAARIMREARYWDVWQFLALHEVVELYPHLRRHLGRARPMWDFLLDGWRADGLIQESA